MTFSQAPEDHPLPSDRRSKESSRRSKSFGSFGVPGQALLASEKRRTTAAPRKKKIKKESRRKGRHQRTTRKNRFSKSKPLYAAYPKRGERNSMPMNNAGEGELVGITVSWFKLY